MPRRLTWFFLALMPALLVTMMGCETHTCQSACNRIYFQCNGTGITPIVPGDDQETAYDYCVEQCSRALYTTSRSADAEEDLGNYDLQTPEDAHQFIECVELVDISDPQCLTDYDSYCPWIRW